MNWSTDNFLQISIRFYTQLMPQTTLCVSVKKTKKKLFVVVILPLILFANNYFNSFCVQKMDSTMNVNIFWNILNIDNNIHFTEAISIIYLNVRQGDIISIEKENRHCIYWNNEHCYLLKLNNNLISLFVFFFFVCSVHFCAHFVKVNSEGYIFNI